MPLLSAFTPCGLFEFTGEVARAETLYRTFVAALGGGAALSFEPGTHNRADAYATAMVVAEADASLRRAGNELHPETAYEMLPAHEDALGITPGFYDSVAERRSAASARNKASRGSREEALDGALSTLLGADFVASYIIPLADKEMWPATYGTAPALFTRPDTIAKTLRLLDPIAPDFATSGVVTVPYENWDTGRADELVVKGDRLLIEGEIPDGAEIVTVTGVEGSGLARAFTATFTKPHALGASATNKPTPIGWSTRRHILIVLKTAAARDVEKRRKVHDLLTRMVRAVTTWSIVHDAIDGLGLMTAYQLDVDSLDTTPLANLVR